MTNSFKMSLTMVFRKDLNIRIWERQLYCFKRITFPSALLLFCSWLRGRKRNRIYFTVPLKSLLLRWDGKSWVLRIWRTWVGWIFGILEKEGKPEGKVVVVRDRRTEIEKVEWGTRCCEDSRCGLYQQEMKAEG